MKVIRFQIEGLINSFRVPFFKTYHKTLLAPPKSTIIGMLCNISLKTQKEFFEILSQEKIKVSVVIEKIEGKSKDLWSYKTLDKKNRGKSVIRRDKLFLPKYIIYILIKDEKLYEDILNNLKYPKNIPALGLDDELIHIKNVEEIDIVVDENNIIDSVFLDNGFVYKTLIKNTLEITEMPVGNVVVTKFSGFDKKGKRISREVIEEFIQVEFINCEIEFESEINSYVDKTLNNRLVFY